MGDMGDFWRDVKAAQKEKRAQNLAQSTELLKEHGVSFESKNFGVHLVVNGGTHGPIDFWPSTGLWIVRSSGKRTRGVKRLLKFIEEKG